MKKVLLSLAVIGVVAAIAIGATTAYFSDTETSTGNTFTAGTIDIELDDQNEPFGGDLIESVTNTFMINDWKPSQIWNPGIISIHNKGMNPIDQLILLASKIDDSDDGLKPESEPATTDGQGGGDLMADDVEIFFVEQWLWSHGAWENTQAREVFMRLINEFSIGPRVPSEREIAMILEEVNKILGGTAGTTEIAGTLSFVDLTPNFVSVYDVMCGNNNGIVTLDELAKGKKNILDGEVLDPSEVKIIIPHFHFASLADNDLQGDVVKFDLTIEGYQVGAPQQEGCVATPNIIP